jgi:uncharacterized membrane protein
MAWHDPQVEEENMGRLSTLLTALGLGAGVMYFYDPAQGKRRRALVKDRVTSFQQDSDRALDVALRDLKNRSRGVLAEGMASAMSLLGESEATPDWLLEERVRAQLGRVARAGRGLQVRAEGGRVTLSGPALRADADNLYRAAAQVRGVLGVDNELELRDSAAEIPGYASREPGSDDWAPSTRLLASAGGGLLALYGGLRRGLVGRALQFSGLALATRGLANTNLTTLLGLDRSRRAIEIDKEVDLAAPVNEVYEFWANLENLPQFMGHLHSVKDLGNRRSHWVAAGPAGAAVQWDAITTREVPNERLEWESIAGSEIKTAGSVAFRANPDGGTHVTIHLGYTPPAGAIGHAVAALFGVDPKGALDADMERLRQMFQGEALPSRKPSVAAGAEGG